MARAGLESPEYAPIIRTAYAVATALMIAFTFYLKSLIQKKNDTTALEYNDPAPGNQGAPRIETTFCRYDLGEVAKLQKSSLFTIAIVAFMHFKFGYIQPLILQTLLPMLNLYKSQLFQIHILGKPAVDSLKRPWTPENPFAALTGGAASTTDVAATDNDSDAGAAAASSSAASSPEASGAKGKSKKETRKDNSQLQSTSHGTLGRRLRVNANFVEISKYPERDIYQYDVVVMPERGEFKKLPPPAYMRSVFDAAMGEHRQGKLKGIPMVYDSRKIAYAPERVCGPKEMLELELSYKEDGRTEKYVIRLREAAVVNTKILTEFIRGRGGVEVGEIQSALNALDLAIGSVLHLEMVGFNRSFFTREQSLSTVGGLELWRGFSFSVRPGIDHLYLNVNTAVTAMYTPGSLLEALVSVVGVREPSMLRGRLTGDNVRDMGDVVKYLRGLQVYCSHRGLKGKRKFSIRGTTTRALDQESFDWEDPERPGNPEHVTVAEYYLRRYNIRLNYPFLPGITDRRKSVFPIEFCSVVENQR
ncbi:hypothetical protein GGI06_003934, partial [Coemansia sp. S85]